ncbi:MOSC N-terminal beta barrel domain-containing protein [Acidimicrobiaceae bacterium AH-315-P05]|nr:MOSC N-terminal beta barrel domain-containing protein [Acidimicrobiaceae bacterium AH-315-P05]
MLNKSPRSVTVKQMWRYPVKSVGGEQVDESKLTKLGLDGDRAWGLRDNATGLFLTARRSPELLLATARLVGDREVVVRLPSGEETNDDVDLSRWLQRDVSLLRVGADDVGYESPKDFVHEDEWYIWEGPGGALHDNYFARVSILSLSSLNEWDVRRFRPNIVIDGVDERSLAGLTLSAGSAVLEVTEEIPRCVMVTRQQPGIVRDLNVLRTINASRNGQLSIGALIREPGRLAVGQRLIELGDSDKVGLSDG